VTSEEIAGRLIVLEVFLMTALGLYLANASNYPDYSKANEIINFLRRFVAQKAVALPKSARDAAESYAENLLADLTANIRILRAERDQSH
jgi:hypothetical protein